MSKAKKGPTGPIVLIRANSDTAKVKYNYTRHFGRVRHPRGLFVNDPGASLPASYISTKTVSQKMGTSGLKQPQHFGDQQRQPRYALRASRRQMKAQRRKANMKRVANQGASFSGNLDELKAVIEDLSRLATVNDDLDKSGTDSD